MLDRLIGFLQMHTVVFNAKRCLDVDVTMNILVEKPCALPMGTMQWIVHFHKFNNSKDSAVFVTDALWLWDVIQLQIMFAILCVGYVHVRGTSSRSLRMSSVSLWCVLMTSALPLARWEALSMRSGRKVPWARNTSSGFRFISPITSFATCEEFG